MPTVLNLVLTCRHESNLRCGNALLQLEYAGILNRQSAISAPGEARGASNERRRAAAFWRASTRFYVPVCPFRCWM